MLNNFKISRKIYLIAGCQLLLIIFVGWLGIAQMTKIGNEIIDIAEQDIPLTNALTELTEHQLQQAILVERALLKGLLATQGADDVKAKAKAELNTLSTSIYKLDTKITGEIKKIEQFIQAAVPKLHSQEAKKEFASLLEKMLVIDKHHKDLAQKVNAILTLVNNQQMDEAIVASFAMEAHQDQLDHELIEVLTEIQGFTLRATQQAEHDEKQGIKLISFALFVAILLALIIPWLIARSIIQPIQELNVRLREISEGDGDLTVRLDDSANNETGEAARSFNFFVEKLSKTITFIQSSATELGQSSETAIKVMGRTLENVEQQRSETEMVANAIHEMGQATQDVAKNTSNAAEVAESAKQRVTEGMTSAVENQKIIKQLANEVNQASSVIESLAAETDNIGTVLEAIRGIAEQTNLLALNAAIEAARAGDTGRGFAVVADEVRTLAQRTQSSTGDIQALVESLQSEAKNAVESMQRGSKSTEMCLNKSTETADALEDANQAVTQIADLNTQIAATSEQQSAAANQITQSVANITRIAEEASQGTQETAGANQSIAKNVIKLHTSLNQFHV